MRAAVHPHRPPLLEIADVEMNRHHLLRLGIAFVPDPQVERPAQDVRRRVGPALVLRHGEPRRVPGVGKGAGAVVDGQTEVVAERRPGNALGLVLVEDCVVAAAEVELRGGGPHGDGERDEAQEGERGNAAHGYLPPWMVRLRYTASTN